MSSENWTKIDTSTENSAEFKARRQIERNYERWAELCDSHDVRYVIRKRATGPEIYLEFSVRDCWPVNDDFEGGPWQVITSTRELWQALGY